MPEGILAGGVALVTVVLAAVTASVIGAEASEDVEIRFIGFSEDGRYFAFGEFALQAGSGYPVVSLYVIDLPGDAWVSGTPFRQLGGEFGEGEDEREAYTYLADARTRLHEKARPLLEQLQIRVPGQVIFARGLGDHLLEGPLNIIRNPSKTNPIGKFSVSYQIHLGEVPLTSPVDYCPLGDAAFGYPLTLIKDDEIEVLHEDSRLPRWRACARHYRLSYVLAGPYCEPEDCPNGPLDVALISVFSDGFEGLGRRFLAAPVPASGHRHGGRDVEGPKR